MTNRTFVIEWESSAHTPVELSELIAEPFQWNAKDETLKNIIWPDQDYSKDILKEYHYCRSCPIRKHNPEWDELFCEEDFGIFIIILFTFALHFLNL